MTLQDDPKKLIDKVKVLHKKNSEENTELVKMNGRTLDKNLMNNKEARERREEGRSKG